MYANYLRVQFLYRTFSIFCNVFILFYSSSSQGHIQNSTINCRKINTIKSQNLLLNSSHSKKKRRGYIISNLKELEDLTLAYCHLTCSEEGILAWPSSLEIFFHYPRAPLPGRRPRNIPGHRLCLSGQMKLVSELLKNPQYPIREAWES